MSTAIETGGGGDAGWMNRLPESIVAIASFLDPASLTFFGFTCKELYSMFRDDIASVEDFTRAACHHGFLNYLHEVSNLVTWFSPFCPREAIIHNHPDVLKYLVTLSPTLFSVKRRHFGREPVDTLLYSSRLANPWFAVCEVGNIDLFNYLKTSQFVSETNSMNLELCYLGAGYGGHVDMLDILSVISAGHINLEDTSKLAAEKGHMHVLDWLRRRNFVGGWVSSHACHYAARGGHIGIINYLIDLGLEVSDETLRHAAATGQVHVIEYLEKRFNFKDVLRTIWTAAVENGALKTVQWVFKRDPQFLKKADDLWVNFNLLFTLPNVELSKFLVPLLSEELENVAFDDSFITYYAALTGSHDLLRFIVGRGFPVSNSFENSAMRVALMKRNKKMIKYLLNYSSYQFSDWDFAAAVGTHSIAFMEYVKSLGCPITINSYFGLTPASRLDSDVIEKIVIWLQDNGAPFDSRTFQFAAENGDFDLIYYIHNMKCPFDAQVHKFMLTEKNKDCAIYLRRYVTPFDKSVFDSNDPNLEAQSLFVVPILEDADDSSDDHKTDSNEDAEAMEDAPESDIEKDEEAEADVQFAQVEGGTLEIFYIPEEDQQ